MKRNRGYIFFTFLVFVLSACSKPETHLNEIQVIGSHNSYKIEIEKPLWNLLYQKDSAKALSLQYAHIPILEQLKLGLRNIELDVFYDPDGGHFSNPKGLDILRENGITPLPYDTLNKLAQPGLKMFHIQDIDFRSHHLLFSDCLQMMKKWSDENPTHTPVFVLMNTKDQKVEGTRDPLPFTKEAFDRLDEEISAVLSEDDLITPDLVRGDCKTLEEAVLKNGWPGLEAMKGRFLFVLDEKAEKIASYLQGHAGLENRILFVNSPEGNPEAAFRIINNPIRDFDYIKDLVAKGYMVRTRADAATRESRILDYTRFDKAKASGAQVISTDYYIPTRLYNSSFKVAFEGNTYERIPAQDE
ncbi:phosphatidylinositol-specific phospholipase C1-like protein [Geofilum sp. OHC36d9]|uniref:phosphatidylinositol-specific phospholipase C1-like protein n=1 Tax=Geofilum sp. OHC36d9 TaxID=3458413 RepID=UPI0040337A32